MKKDYSYLKSKIHEVCNFPKPGVKFQDITPLLEDRMAFQDAVNGLADFFKGQKIDKVVGIDARGFLVAAPVAYLLGAGLAIVRKRGKLPSAIIREYHELEYGRAALDIHASAIKKGETVIIIDDVLATGGTASAAARLVEALKADVVGMGFLLELVEFQGRDRLKNYRTHSLILY